MRSLIRKQKVSRVIATLAKIDREKLSDVKQKLYMYLYHQIILYIIRGLLCLRPNGANQAFASVGISYLLNKGSAAVQRLSHHNFAMPFKSFHSGRYTSRQLLKPRCDILTKSKIEWLLAV